MNRIITICAAILMTASMFAQSPEKMSYQAVVRDGSDALVTSAAVGMQISILQGTANGSAVYVETQTPAANANGLVSLEIGTGTIVSGDFSTIDWATGPYFIKTETDPKGGTSYSITGTSQLMSVPYALYAKESGSSLPGLAGEDGEDGVGITSTTDNNDGTFTLNFSDGSVFTTANLTGTQGATGATGPQGPTGAPGNDGIDGQDGEDGVGITSTTDNNDGTFTLNFSDGSVFTTANLTGPQGATGATGPQGPIGAPGNDGIDGENGEDGVGITSTTDNNDGTFTLSFSDGSVFTTANLTGPQGLAGTVESLASGSILVGDTGNAPTAVSLSGDATLTNSGDLTISDDAITTNKLQDASVTDAKLDKANIPLSGFGVAAADVDMGSNKLKNLTDPTEAQDAVTKTYVDALSPNLGDNPGEMQYWNGSDWVSVAPGKDGQVLSYSQGVPTWKTVAGNTDIMSSTGQIWMDRNLGATQVATSSKDYLAYGDLYQWGRGADGHQTIVWTSATESDGEEQNNEINTTSNSTTPGTAYIIGSSNWYTGSNPDNLWQGVDGVNNPCPTGYRVPTEAEWKAELGTGKITNAQSAFDILKLPMAGFRYSSGSLSDVGTNGRYWSSTGSQFLNFDSSSAKMLASIQASGRSVRCFRD